ncbi:MAG: BamA/TamA family outer membrane protein [Chitinophagaceae bacterium]|nr:BamA/TamA family outer membrane protein [Chitinophagaceae bacterium]
MPLKRTIWLLLIALLVNCQPLLSQAKYQLIYYFTDKDSSVTPQSLGLQTLFSSREQCVQYIGTMPSQLQSKGYITASVDSVAYDSSSVSAWVFLGAAYKWVKIKVSESDQQLVNAAGWSDKTFTDKMLDFQKLVSWQEKALNYLENQGYPFAKVQLDSLQIDDDKVSACLKIEKGPLYKIDSIRVFGKAKISNFFLQKYLGIENGTIYKKEKLQSISTRLLELPYLQESRGSSLTMLGTGSILDLYLEPKKSSQINALVGFLPANSQLGGKLLLTGEVNINLKNALGGGETIGANWQQIQVKSPRLNLVFQQPYMFRSAFGLDFSFDLFKKDSSFLNLNAVIGLQYMVSARQSGKVFFQTFSTNLLTIDTAQIQSSKRLPPYLDVSTNNLGVDYQFNNTDYRFNPRRGNELSITVSGGLRTIKKNNTIVNITKDGGGNSFDFGSLYDTLKLKSYIIKTKLVAAHYFRISKQSAIKAGINGGIIQTQNPFRNEVFQIGGYRLLRGFDEESIFTNRYAVATAEYRYLIGLNSFLFVFTDGGWAQDKTFAASQSHTYFGTGLGMAFETRAGIFNISYAVGKRDDSNLNFRQAKIHFGFVSIF